jgi:uroporphyrin-III C-methyltransferase/precorrin-2 dehydrogenase/sirohydrochlorin ferrochelatase
MMVRFPAFLGFDDPHATPAPVWAATLWARVRQTAGAFAARAWSPPHAPAATAPLAPRPGMVFLVGAGPGSADLLTVRAHRVLSQAEVVVHDRLVSEEVLDLIPRTAERIHVGKARGNHCLPQDAINRLLVRLAREGHRVVRLKGGDPLVFGRGGEEIEALETAGVTWEVVPGVTAALACAAQFGIPLTHRRAARALVLATGHTMQGCLDLEHLGTPGPDVTHAFYMASAVLPALREGLLARGFDPALPAAIIYRGGSPHASLHRGTLDKLPSLAPTGRDPGPGLVLLGRSVALGRTAAMLARETAAA